MSGAVKLPGFAPQSFRWLEILDDKARGRFEVCNSATSSTGPSSVQPDHVTRLPKATPHHSTPSEERVGRQSDESVGRSVRQVRQSLRTGSAQPALPLPARTAKRAGTTSVCSTVARSRLVWPLVPVRGNRSTDPSSLGRMVTVRTLQSSRMDICESYSQNRISRSGHSLHNSLLIVAR